jgi:hypothetical protein
MPKSLKQLLDQVNAESGFDVPNTYIGSSDPNIAQLVAIANRCAVLLRDMRLQYLIKQANIPMTGGLPTEDSRIFRFPLPDDYYCLVPDTTYQFGRIDPAQLPTPASTWAYLKSRSGPEGLRVRDRIIGNQLYVFSPDATQSQEFEYISSWTIRAQGIKVATRDTFTLDTDTWMLDDPLIELEILWRYKLAKGLDAGQDKENSRLYQNELRGRDVGAQIVYPPGLWPWPGFEPYTNLWVQ